MRGRNAPGAWSLAGLVAAGAAGTPPAVAAAPAAVIEARVQDESGRPLRDTWVWVVWDRGAPFKFEGRRRRVLNPKGHTGDDGRLRIEVPPGFFAASDRLALAWEDEAGGRSRFTALHDAASGERLAFSLGETGPRVDFGRLIAPAPRPD